MPLRWQAFLRNLQQFVMLDQIKSELDIAQEVQGFACVVFLLELGIVC